MQRENVTSSEKYESSFLSKERYEFPRRNIRNKNSKVSKLSTALKRKLASSKSMAAPIRARIGYSFGNRLSRWNSRARPKPFRCPLPPNSKESAPRSRPKLHRFARAYRLRQANRFSFIDSHRRCREIDRTRLHYGRRRRGPTTPRKAPDESAERIVGNFLYGFK